MISRVGRLSSVLALWLVASSALAQEVSPPSTKDSVQFLVMGDTGTGQARRHRRHPPTCRRLTDDHCRPGGEELTSRGT